jgi:hypothetical protein
MIDLSNSKGGWWQRGLRTGGGWLAAGLLAWGLGGCSSSEVHPHDPVTARGGVSVVLPQLIVVTTGPVAVLVTNGGAFSAEFTLAFDDRNGPPLKLSGVMLVSGGKVRAEFARVNGKALPGGDIDVIWDAAAHQGWVISEALQGYGRVNDAVHCTNVLVAAAAGGAGQVDGHPVDRADVTLQCGDGQNIKLVLSRALDLGRLPLQMQLVSESDAFGLGLSKVQAAKLTDDLFLPPEDFTKFANAVDVVNELAFRQHEVNNGNRGGAPGQTGPRSAAPPGTQ